MTLIHFLVGFVDIVKRGRVSENSPRIDIALQYGVKEERCISAGWGWTAVNADAAEENVSEGNSHAVWYADATDGGAGTSDGDGGLY